MKVFAIVVLTLIAMPILADGATDKQAFDARCAKCHAESGTGTFMLGRRLGKDNALLERRTDLTSDLIRQVVRTGIFSMPALTRVEVTDDELDAIVRYLRGQSQ